MLRWPLLGRLQLRHFTQKASQLKRRPSITCSMNAGNPSRQVTAPLMQSKGCFTSTKYRSSCILMMFCEYQETAVVRFLPHSNDININIVLGGQQRFMSRCTASPVWQISEAVSLIPFIFKDAPGDCLPCSKATSWSGCTLEAIHGNQEIACRSVEGCDAR